MPKPKSAPTSRFAKPTSRSSKEIAKAAYPAARKAVRAKAHTLDRGRCIWPTCRALISLEFAHEHEVKWRGRGGSALDVENVVTTCPDCHRDIHPRIGGLKKKMEGTRSTGFKFFEKHGDEWVEVQ